MDDQLAAEVDSLLQALRLKPREQWADEAGGVHIAGRCGGSYGCSVPVVAAYSEGEMIARAEANSGSEFVWELANLVRAGVAIENAAAALARKFGANASLAPTLTALIHLLRDPNATRASVANLLADLVNDDESETARQTIIDAVQSGNLDRLAT